MSVAQGERVQDDCCLQEVVAALPRDAGDVGVDKVLAPALCAAARPRRSMTCMYSTAGMSWPIRTRCSP
ncbi:hypothetical protein ASD97_23510 [Streptomyces sp. Root63]|nr:hypothetical protein ASD29_28745 [Streptomyces sp. Root1295]KRA34533.1 hypothetical protein ASD97_23510 [Streptomyces sp. Root63]